MDGKTFIVFRFSSKKKTRKYRQRKKLNMIYLHNKKKQIMQQPKSLNTLNLPSSSE